MGKEGMRMAKDLNKVQLTGRLGADPEMRFTAQGTSVTTFRVASGRGWTSTDGEKHEETEWFRIVAWNKLAEICNNWLGKGDRVYIEGRLQTRHWQDQNGQERSTTEVIAQDLIILESRRSAPPVDADSVASDDEQPETESTTAGARHSTTAPHAQATNGTSAASAQSSVRRPPARAAGGQTGATVRRGSVEDLDLPF
jgi:single-strand DNA-binding protein